VTLSTPSGRHRDLLDEGHAAQLFHDRGIGHEHHVVLVLTDARLPFDRPDAGDGERLVPDANHLTRRIDVRSEELIADGAAEYGNLR
jgi:hypothetical protein